MRKTLAILMLFSVGCAHVAANESNALKLYPLTLTKSEMSGSCIFQLKSTKSPEIVHFVHGGICSAARILPADQDWYWAGVSAININNNQMILRNISQDGCLASAHFKNDTYAVGIKFKERNCDNKKVPCMPFYLDAVLTVKKGVQQQTFDMQGKCGYDEEEVY